MRVHSPLLMLVRSAHSESWGVGVTVGVAGGTGVGVAGGVTRIGGATMGGAGSMTGTFSALAAATKSAETQPMPLGAAGIDAAHQRLSALRPTISPSSPKRAKPMIG